MIIRFEVQNFRSIRDAVELLLTPGKERQHASRIPRHAGTDGRTLEYYAPFTLCNREQDYQTVWIRLDASS